MPEAPLYPIKENILPQESILPQKYSEPRPYADIPTGAVEVGAADFLPPAARKNDIAKTVTTGELYNARRYSMYDPTKTEDDYAYGQSNWDKAANGILKGVNLAGTTVLGGFGMLGGALASPFTGHLSTIWDNKLLRGLDEWNNEVDNNILPNYYTDAEKNAAWYSSDNWFKTNFIFDKLVKNSGFAVGAMLSGNLADAAILRSGAAIGRAAMAGAEAAEASRAFKTFSPLLKNMARAFSQGKNIEVANALEKEISSIADITAKNSEIAKIAQSTNKFAGLGDAGRRAVIATYSSAGESTFEALQTSNEFRNNLIQDWKDKHDGEEPIGSDLQKINEQAEKVGKTSFFGNMALLTITERAQLPKLIGSSYAAEKQAANSLMGKVDDVLLKESKYVAAPGATTKFGKLLSRAGGISKYIFDPKEASQEGLQFALQVGTENYFKKAYQSKAADAVTDGFLYGLVGVNEKGEGVGALNSKEGAESIALGGVTGGLMQIKGNIVEGRAIKSNTEQFIDKLNSVPKFQEAFKERLAAANRGVVLQQQQQDAVLNGDELEAKDLNADQMHNYLAPRIKYGRFDMVMDDIADLKRQGSTEQGLVDLKEEGLANINDTIQSYQQRLTKFETVAKNTEEIYKATNLRYSGEIIKDEKGEPILDADGKQQRKYSDRVIDKMVYAASKIADYDLRIPSVNMSLVEAGVNTQDILDSIIKNNKPNKEATAQALNQINDLDVRSDIKDDLKTKLSDTIELSLRRKLFLDEYNDIKTKPLNYEILPGYEYDKDEKDKTPVTVSQKDEEAPEKKLEIGKEYSLKDSVLKEGSMLHLAPKISVLSQTLGGELEVKLPSGKVTFMSPEEFKKYQISDDNNTSKEMSDVLDKAIDTVLKDEKFQEVKKDIASIPGDKLEDKLAYINSLDNQSLINAIEKEFNTQTEDIRKQKEEAEKLAKQIAKNKEQIDKEQKEIEATSGDVSIIDVNSEEVQQQLKQTGKEDKRRPADELFIGSITESEGSENPNFQKDPTQSAPHIKRSRRFLNNIKNSPNRSKIRAILVTYKNEKALGLEGLSQLSYSKEDIDLDTEEKKKAFTKELMDPITGFIAQVYTIQDGKDLYFSDENGNKIKDANGKEIKVREKVDLNQVIFQSQPSATIEYSDGSPKYREGEKEKAEAYQTSYIQYRKSLLESPEDANPPIFKILITRGVPRRNVTETTDENGNKINVSEKNHVGGILIPEAKISSQDNLILLPTNGSVEHNGKLLKFPTGTPVLQYGDTLEFLNNRKFTSEEAKSIYAVINAMANKIIAQTKAGKKVVFDPGYKTFLKNVLYWKAGAKTDNQFFIDGSSIYIGKSAKYAIGEVANNKDAIVKQLEGMFMNINNFTIKDSLSKKFYEYTLDKNDNLTIKEWKNYQTYLLSAKNPDGSARSANETPLSTSIAKPTEDLQSFKSKSSVLIGLDLPIVEIVKAEPTVTAAPKTVTKIGDFTLDNTTENSIKVSDKFGDVKFTAVVDENGNIVVTPKANKEIQIIAKDRDQVAAFEKWLLDNGFEPGKTSEEKVLKVASIIISNKLIDEQAKTPAVTEEVITEAPKVEEKKEETKPTTTEPKDFGGFSGPSTSFRAVVPGEKGAMTDAELQLFKDWHSKNVPNIPFEVLNNLITINGTKKAWGVFENGVAKFVKGGLKGTEYHEIFHGIFQGFLNDAKQQDLRNEFRNRQGSFVDRMTGRNIEYSKATDSQIEDRLADEFTDFRLGKIKAKSLTQKIVDFFRSILDFIKSFVNKPSIKDSLFEAIDSGKFKEAIPGESKIGSDYRAATGLTEKQTHEFVEDMTARASGIIYSEADKNALFNPLKITSSEMFSRIEDMYRKEKNAAGVSKREYMGDEAWRELVVKTKESLRTLGVNFNEDDLININDESQVDRLYAPEPFTIDAKKSSPFAIKFTLATLFETKATNQENELSLVMPEPKTSNAGYKLLNFSRAFATVLDKLCNTTKISKAVEKLADLASYDSNYVRLFSRVGGSYSKDENGKMSKIMDFSQFQNDDWRLFIQMMQTFTKQKPEALIQYKNGNSIHTAPANLFTAIKTKQRSWIENIRARAQDKSTSFITFNTDSKTYKVDTARIKEMTLPKTPKDMTEFLGKIGVIFPMEVYSKLKTESLGGGKSQTTQFAEAVGALYSQLGKNGDIYSVTGKALDVDSRFAKLAELYVKVTNPNQDSTYPNVEGEKTNAYSENNAPSVFENEFNESETIDELLKSRPELHDLFNDHSLVLQKGGTFFNEEGKRIKEIKIKYIQGTSDSARNKGTTTAKLNLGGRFTQEINQNLNGDYYILIPADSSTEWMINLGNHISFEDFAAGRADKQIHTIFEGYLMDDIALALDADNREKLKNIGSKAKELRFFKDILSRKDSEGNEKNEVLKEINKLLANDKTTYDDLKTYVKNNLVSINESVDEYINNTVTNTIQTLKNSKEVVNVKSENVSYSSLDDTFVSAEGITKNNMSPEELNNIIKFANTNYIINNIEMHKLIFGDPYQFKIQNKKGKVILDETKRIKSFLSPRRTTFDSPEYNTWLRNNRNQVAGVELTSDDYGYQYFKEYTNTVTLTDMTVASSLANTMSVYDDINEADAMSWLMDGTYREIKLKNGQWTDEAEDWHQWQMAYTRQNFPGYTYTSEALKKHDAKLISKPAPKHVIEVLKPIVSGAKYGATTMDNILDKFSQMPIYYSMVQGTNLEKLYDKMFKANIGYAIFESGRKVGITETHNLYTDNGDINNEAFNNLIPVSWKSYGIQVETTLEGEKSQTRGSQLTKLSTMDLFENGEASPKALEEYKNNMKLLNEMHRNAFKELLNKLGLVDTGSGYALPDKTAISNALVAEMLRREMSDNAKETLKLDENKQFRIPFEASPSYVQIRNIIYSMIDKAIISPKMSGGAHVQVSVTGFESATKGKALIMKNDKGLWEKISKEKYASLTDEQKKGVMLSDDTLKFYQDEKGKRYCEIMVPHWFKSKFGKKTDKEILDYLNKPENENILRGIGFRIPTQALSSVEVFKVKGFLPQYMGATVVVPSEITKKAGSDFDIDKLNMYLKSVYKDENRNVKLVKYLGSEESTKAFYADVYEKTIQKKIDRIERFDEFRDKLLDVIAKIESSEDEEVDVESVLTDEEYGFYEDHIDIFSQIEEQAAEKDISGSDYILSQMNKLDIVKEKLTSKMLSQQLKDDFVNDMYKRSLENAYYDSLENLITLPENFQRLISPVGDAGLSDVADDLDRLRGYNESNIKNRILDRNYMTSLRHAFVVAKRWVGIAAVNITNHSLAQKSKIYIDPKRMEAAPKADKKFLKDGSMILPHNTVSINGEDLISLSGRTVKDSKELISNRLSGYATAFVDVAKDPYIMKIIKSDLIVGTFMFLERVGVGPKAIKFLNQPIISEYISMLDNLNTKNLYNEDNINLIKMMFDTTENDAKSTGINISDKHLDENIENYYIDKKLSPAQNAEQHAILDEFLKYAKMADYNFKFTQATNYDTTKFRSGDTLSRKQMRTSIALKTNIISSVNDILNNTFIGEQEKLLSEFAKATGEIFKLEQDQFRSIIDSVLEPYKANEYMSQDNYEKIANKIRSSLIDYAVQINKGYNTSIKALLVDVNTSIAKQLSDAKEKYKDSKILNDLEIESSPRPGGAMTVKLNVNLKDAYDENLYTGMMAELRDNPNTRDLYNNLVVISILQGSYQSAVSIKNIIPIEDYSRIVAPIISGLQLSPEIEAFSKIGSFQRTNFKDDIIMPILQPKFFLASEAPVYAQVNQFGDHYADIFQYYSSMFPNIAQLNIKSTDRRILLLSEKYNSFDLKNDFVKVPRVVTDRVTGDSIDMLTGESITPKTYAERKAKGDMTLNDVIGYKKVKYKGSGEPVITTDNKGNDHHVYKVINLRGDGQYATEHYSDDRMSVLNNGTMKIDFEIPDEDIIEYYGGEPSELDFEKVEENVVPSQSMTQPSTQATGKVEVSKVNYTKETPNDKSKGFFFTENLQAYLSNRDRINEVALPVSSKGIKLNVTAENNQAGIRTTSTGERNENAFAIISKKFQQNETGNFVKEEGQFKNTDEDFELFKKYNSEAINEALAYNKPLVISAGGIATGKSALPLRFAEWLNNELKTKLSIQGEVKQNTTPGYNGYGIFNLSTQPSTNIGIKDEGSIVYDPEEDRVGMTVGSDEKGYVNVKFDLTDEIVKLNKSKLELSDAFSLKDASKFNDIKFHIGDIMEVDNSKLRLLSVDETDYDNVKFLKFQSRSGLIVPAIIEYNEETGNSEIIPNPDAWELGLEDDEYNTDDFKC